MLVPLEEVELVIVPLEEAELVLVRKSQLQKQRQKCLQQQQQSVLAIPLLSPSLAYLLSASSSPQLFSPKSIIC